MKRSFKEKAVFTAVKVSKKCIILKPAAYFILGVVLGVYRLCTYFYLNGKRYIAALVGLTFFFMSSSFTTLDKSVENNVYLDSATPVEETVQQEVKQETVIDPVQETVPLVVNVDYSDILDDVDPNGEDSTDASEQFSIDEIEVDADTDIVGDTSSFDKNAWYLILVNKTHPIPDDYKVKLATIKGNLQCDERVLKPLLDMLNAAKKDGVNIYVTSPYRSGELQQTLFNKRIRILMENHGYSYVDAYKAVSQKVIVPGTSEHQLGMCFDIVTDYHKTLDFEFANTQAGKWLVKHCAEYGFILRYPRGKEDITGIEFEPWHFRFVGVEAAEYIMEHGITLEEFLEGL
ncbi:MAG: M15 family metallopeptidase [Lachnospiraceae bacterium]|nr:M15 family metallopeptidase [Lachnospiraceae bacterium]